MIIGVHCVTRLHDPRRMWPKEYWVELLRGLIDKYYCAIMFIGAFQPIDVKYVEDIIFHLDPDRVLFEPRQTTLNEDAVLMKMMDVLICLNSAPMAIATAIGTPVFGIVGYGPASVTLPVRLDVGWIEDPGLADYDPEHPARYTARMNEIAPQDVFRRVVSLLENLRNSA